MVFLVPLIAVGIGFFLIALIKRGSPAIEYERMGGDEKLEPDEQALVMEEEPFRIFIIDFFAAQGFEPVKMYEESDGVFILVMENRQPVFGGKQVLKCIRTLEAGSVASKEVARFREIVRGEPGARGILFSALPFTIEAQEVARDLGIELIGPSVLRRIVATGRATAGPAEETDPSILPPDRPWEPEKEEHVV